MQERTLHGHTLGTEYEAVSEATGRISPSVLAWKNEQLLMRTNYHTENLNNLKCSVFI